jgi:putative ABC transport system permease protein
MWQQRFGYRTGVLGESLKVDGEAHTIVGVMPSGWAFPEYAQAWTPIRLEPGDRNREERSLDVIARLRPDVSFESAQGSLSSLATHVAAEYPETNAGWGFRATPLLEDMTPPGVRVTLVVMIGAAGVRAAHRLCERREHPAGPGRRSPPGDRHSRRPRRRRRASFCGRCSSRP